jgi:carboxymethylenebutenolidase
MKGSKEMLKEVRIENRMSAYLGRPDGRGKRPAIIHLHERYGIVQHTSDLAQKLLDAGYIVLVPDLFSRFIGDRKALANGDLHVELSDEEVLQDLDAAIAHLKTLPEADASRLAMVGVCQTGRQPLLVSAERNYLAGAVVLYGAIYKRDWEPHPLRPQPVDRLLERVSCPVQGIFAELDNLISLEDILRMRNVLEQAKKSFDIRVYPEAPHGFLNDTMPGRYRPEQAKAAWQEIISFLNMVLDGGWNRERVFWRFEADSSPNYDFTKHKRWA